MKTQNSLLRLEDIEPYMKGSNSFFHTNPSGEPSETSIGEIKCITPRIGTDGIVTSLVITTSWLVRVRTAVSVGSHLDLKEWEPIPDSYRREYDLPFERPILKQKRGPLTFESNGEIVELTHLTKLAKMVLDIKAKVSS